MNVRRTFRNGIAVCLTAALPLTALWHVASAAAPSHAAAAGRPATALRALSARLHALLAPPPAAPAAPAVAYSASFHLSDYMTPAAAAPGPQPSAKGPGSFLLRRRPQPSITTPTTDPVTLVPYSASEVIHITNAAGQTVRAPASAADNIGPHPNQPLTFTVTVDNVLTDANGNPTMTQAAATTASAVYLQFKNPNSAYQGTDGIEHKVFTSDGINKIGTDSGSATRQLFNGGQGSPYSLQNNVFIGERGAVGGTEGTDQFLGVGRGIRGHALAFTSTATPPVTTPGVDSSFVATGQEYECQFVAPFDNGLSTPTNPSGYIGTGDATAADYGTPFYLAGYDDQRAGSFTSVPTTGNGNDWLALHQSTTNPNQYTATWCPPASASDFYLDAVVVDSQKNWRIFDNVWGFSTLPFQGTNDILFVADNVLGQKFAASALANRGLTNLRPIFFGAESYFTGIDTALLPDAVYDYGSLTNYSVNGDAPTGNGLRISNLTTDFYVPGVLNGLGYGSYTDTVDTNTTPLQNGSQLVTVPVGDAAGLPYPKSQAYSIWRILCRGALDPTLLTRTPIQGGYARNGFAGDGTSGTQPPVQDPVSGFTAPASSTVPINTRCVLWASPFTGDQPLNSPGSILDTSTQQILRQYVANGGRLFVSGQEVASALTLNGQGLNAAGGFVYDVLNAKYIPTTTGSLIDNQTLAGVSGAGNPLGNDAYFDFYPPFHFDDIFSFFLQFNPTGPDPYTPPGAVVPALGNDYVQSADSGTRLKWRSDGALTQLGPYTEPVGGSTIQSNVNLVTPVNAAISQFGLSGSSGMIYKSDITDAVGSGYGSRVIFASFGLEGVGIEYYKTSGNNFDFFSARNVRPNILHNIVSYLRTGSYEGRIFLGNSTSQGVPGATVYLIPFLNVHIPGPRQTYSATTSDGTDGRPVGSYHIDGIEPGGYLAVAYKTGYSRSTTPTNNASSQGQHGALGFTAAGDTTAANVNLNISPLPNGSIAGKVTLNTAAGPPAIGATVTFKTTDGTTVTTTTAADGTYSVSAPVGTYSGVATTTSPAGTSNTQMGVVVNTAQTTPNVNFIIVPSPATITGQVALVNVSATTAATATVAATASGATTPAAAVTVPLTGTTPATYTLPGLPAGTYTVTASATGYVPTNTAGDTVTLTSGATVTASPTLTLRPSQSVTLTGTVTTAAAPGLPIAGATVTVKTPAGNSVTTAQTNANGVYAATVLEGTYGVTAGAFSYNTSASQTVTLTASVDPPVNFQLAQAPTLNGGGYATGSYNLISYPNEYAPGGATPLDGIFGAELTAANPGGNRGPGLIYSSSAASYVAEPNAPADGLHLGLGYFIYLQRVAGIFGPLLGTPPSGPTVSVALQGGGSLDGWNMVGVPSQSAVSASRLGVQTANGSVFTFAQAVSSGYVGGSIYGFHPSTGSAGSYYTVGGGALLPYQGYWVRAKIGGLHLIIPTTGG